MSERVRMAVIGAGRMGGFHARVCAESDRVDLLAVVDRDLDRARPVAAERNCEAVASVDELPGEIDAAVVAVPTVAHVAVAEPLLAAGVACLVEKPLAESPDEARRLVDAAERGGATLQVGHTERFNPAFMALGRYELEPRFVETVRISPCRFRSMDVGVVMDLMIHDIDLVLSLVRSDVADVDAVGVNLLGPVEDMANVRVRFASGAVADFVASRAALKVERRIRVYSTEAYVGVDFGEKQGIVVRPGERLRELQGAAAAGGGFDPAAFEGCQYEELLDIEHIAVDDHDALGVQLAAFIAAVRGEGPVVVSGDDGYRAVDLAQRIVEAIAQQSPHKG